MGRWSDSTTVAFVKLYREEQILWNSCLPEYRDRRLRNHALQRLVDAMNLPNFTIVEASKKIKSLRSTYHHEMGKIRTTNLGDGVPYNPVVPWFKDMEYVMLTAASGEQAALEMQEQNPIETIIQDSNDDVKTKPTTNKWSEKKDISGSLEKESSLHFEQIDRRPKRKYHQHRVNVKKSKLERIEEVLLSLNKAMINPREDSKCEEKEEDECDVIGKHVALQLRELSVADRIQANIDIQKILMEYRLKTISS